MNTATLEFDYGEDWFVNVTCADANDGALDITGATLTFILGPSADPLIQVSGAASGDPTLGVAAFHIAPADQASIAPPSPPRAIGSAVTYPFLVRVTLASGVITDQVAGQVAVSFR